MLTIIWNEIDEDGNAAHIAEHGLTFEDVENILENFVAEFVSHTSGRPGRVGYTKAGDRAVCWFEWEGEDIVNPVTAYRLDKD